MINWEKHQTVLLTVRSLLTYSWFQACTQLDHIWVLLYLVAIEHCFSVKALTLLCTPFLWLIADNCLFFLYLVLFVPEIQHGNHIRKYPLRHPCSNSHIIYWPVHLLSMGIFIDIGKENAFRMCNLRFLLGQCKSLQIHQSRSQKCANNTTMNIKQKGVNT